MNANYSFLPPPDLPVQPGLPDPFLDASGRRVTARAAWPAQRQYLKAMLRHYMYGHSPPLPEQVAVEQTLGHRACDGKAYAERYTLTIERGGQAASCEMALFRPVDGGPRPAIVKNCGVLFDADELARLPERKRQRQRATIKYDLAAAGRAVERGYVLCKFRRTDLAPDDAAQCPSGVQLLYPECDWGAIAVWAWGHSVVADALVGLGYADAARIAATGHSRGGQAAIAAGIFDERIAVVVPCTGGYGSCATLRVRDPEGARGREDYIATHLSGNAHWHVPRYHQFAGRLERMPFDAHTLVGLVAPRPLLNTNASEDPFNNALAVEAGIKAGRVVHQWLGSGDWCRLHWRPGGHAQRAEDWAALMDFCDEYFHGQRGASRFDQWVHADFSPPLAWAAPEGSADQ